LTIISCDHRIKTAAVASLKRRAQLQHSVFFPGRTTAAKEKHRAQKNYYDLFHSIPAFS
jgi:hypothetical protein